LPWVSDLVTELKLDTFGLVDIQVSESAPTSVTYMGSHEPVHQVCGFRQRIVLTVICASWHLNPGSKAPIGSLTHWLHTMVLVRNSARMGMTVILPDQSQWAVQSYDITMDSTQIPRIHLELVGLRIPKIKDIDKWMPTKIQLDKHQQQTVGESKKKIGRKDAFWRK